MTGAELKAFRKKMGLSQSDFGAAVGRTKQSVSAFERERSPIPARVKQLIDQWQKDEPSKDEGAEIWRTYRRERDILAAKFSYAICEFNRALDAIAIERMKGGMPIDTAYERVVEARKEFDAGLAAVDAKHAPEEPTNG